MSREKKVLFVLSILLIMMCVIFVIIRHSSQSTHNQVKEYILESIQKSIDSEKDNPSFRTNMHEINGQLYFGRVYIVNNSSDLVYIQGILAKCRPLTGEYQYKPTDIHAFVGGVNIGYTGGSGHYYWVGENGEKCGFVLSERYNKELWAFFDGLEIIEVKDETFVPLSP